MVIGFPSKTQIIMNNQKGKIKEMGITVKMKKVLQEEIVLARVKMKVRLLSR